MSFFGRLLGAAGGGGGSIPPAGLIAHWDFGAGVTLVSSRISAVADQSGNDHHLTQATAANRPQLSATPVGGLPAVEFDGVSVGRWLTIPTAVGTAFTVVFVMDADVTATVGATHPVGWYLLVGATQNHFQVTANSDIWAAGIKSSTGRGYWVNGVDDNLNPSVTPLDQPNIVAVTHTSGYAFTSNARMGGDQFATVNRNFGGRLAEMFLYNTVLSTGDRHSLESYLAAKYGISISH